MLQPVPAFASRTVAVNFMKNEYGWFRLPQKTSNSAVNISSQNGPKVLLPEADEYAAQRFYERVEKRREIADREKARKINEESRKRKEELREGRRKLGILNLGSTLASKQKAMQASKIDQTLLQSCQPISLPNNFPKNFNEFFGNPKKIMIKNEVTSYTVIYQAIDKDILFFFTGTKHLESFEQVVNKVCQFVGKNNYNRIFLMWDPLSHSLASRINKSTPIIGAGKLSRGGFQPI